MMKTVKVTFQVNASLNCVFFYCSQACVYAFLLTHTQIRCLDTLLVSGDVVCILGSSPYLGDWDERSALPMR